MVDIKSLSRTYGTLFVNILITSHLNGWLPLSDAYGITYET